MAYAVSLREIKARTWGFEPAKDWDAPLTKRFVAYYYFIDWDCISLGVHFCIWNGPNIEIHLPFGFIRIGWMRGAWQ